MPHVSKQQLKKETFIQISDLFFATVTTPRRAKILRNLLTKTERIMLAKRLAMIAMLSDGQSTDKVKKVLGVSFATAARFQQRVRAGRYKVIEEMLKEQKFERSLGGIIAKSIGKQLGRGTWDFLDEGW